MRLLEPYFLYAFLALAIPIIIHLFSLQRHKTVYFSNVAFLKQLRQKKGAISKLQKLLLLFTRLLLLSSIILAFGEPYLSKENKAIKSKKIIGIYIDNSFSMSANNEIGPLIEQAKNKARTIVNAHKDKDSFIFISNELQGKHQRIINYQECINAIDQISIKAPVLTSDLIIQRWNLLKQNEINNDAELFIISDFQKASFSENFFMQDTSFKHHLLPINSYPRANIYIDSCYFKSPNHNLKQQEWLYFEVANESNEDIINLPVKLFINDKQKALSTISIKANSKTTSKFSFNNHNVGEQKAYIELNDPVITFDNRIYFNYTVVASNKVLSIYENNPSNELNILFQDEGFEYNEMHFKNLNFSSIINQNLIILDRISSPTTGFINKIKPYVENGGNLLIIPPNNIDQESYRKLSENLKITEFIKKNENNVRVSEINNNHHIFKNVFEAETNKIDLPKVNLYYSLKKNSLDSEETIMSLNTKEPFICSYSHKLGSIYVMASPLDKNATNLVNHALFVPVMFNMATKTSSSENIYFTIGKQKTIHLKDNFNHHNWRIQKENEIDILPEARVINQQIYLKLQDQIQSEGFYNITNQDFEKTISFNFNRKESEITSWDMEDLDKICQQNSHLKLWQKSGDQLEKILRERRSGTSLWHTLMIIAMFLIILESILMKQNKRGIRLRDIKTNLS